MHDVDPDIENIAVEIKREFRNQKTQQLGKTYRPAAARFNDDGVWLKAAMACKEAGASPVEWVAACFRYQQVPGGPFPNMLSGKQAGRWYYELRRSVDTGPDGEEVDELEDDILNCMRRVVVRHICADCSAKEILMDQFEPLPDIIRVILLPKDEDMLQKWGRSAYAAVVSNPHLKDVLVKMGMDLSWMDRFSN